MDKTTHEVRLRQWRQVIEQCQARPEGQTAKQWLDENKISKKSYYYWLRKIRQQAYEQSSGEIRLQGQNATGSAVPSQGQPKITFAEVPFPLDADSSGGDSCENAFTPSAIIKIGNASVAFSNSASERLLSGIIREVLGHA